MDDNDAISKAEAIYQRWMNEGVFHVRRAKAQAAMEAHFIVVRWDKAYVVSVKDREGDRKVYDLDTFSEKASQYRGVEDVIIIDLTIYQ